MITYLILGAAYGFASAVQPGVFQTYIVSQGLLHGWRRVLPATCAPLLSDGPIIVAVLLFLTHVPLWFEHALQLIGGIFVLYLAYNAWGSWKGKRQHEKPTSATTHRTIIKAALVNLLNPAPYLGWSLVMGPLLIQAWNQAPMSGVGLIAGFYATMIAVEMAIVYLFVRAATQAPVVSRALIGVSIILLAGFGLYMIWIGASTMSSN
jgi:threonine/homoserine/homoserine lactone efflux protein